MGVPLQEVAWRMKVLYERVAGIDVHKDMIKVAIRSPGEKPWTRTTEILEFRTFYGVLQAMARELRRRGVTVTALYLRAIFDTVERCLAASVLSREVSAAHRSRCSRDTFPASR